ncbi:MAG: CHAT domain-containing protein [Cyanobacteria bacterium P01_C01_bin.69]
MLPFWIISPPALSTPIHIAGAPAPVGKQAENNDSAENISELLTVAESQQASGEYTAAIATFQSAITRLNQTTPTDIELKGRALYGLGDTYMASQAYSNAIPVFEEAIALFATPNHTRQTNLAASPYANYLITLSIELGQAHEYLAHFGTALEYYQQVLTTETAERINPFIRASVLTRKGIVETEIGQFTEAEATLQQAAELSRQLDSPEQAADAIAALAWTYEQQNDFERAITTYQNALSLYQQTNDTNRAILTLSNIGTVQLKQNNLSTAQNTLNQALSLTNEETDPYYKTVLFDSFGTLYQSQGNFEQAWQSYRKTIALSLQSSDKVSEIGGWINLGNLIETQANPQLAIFFYKRAIAQIETIRQDLQPLSSEAKKRYTLTVEDTYRHLADLLLQQDRTEEAVEILELLKIQEVKTYLQSGQTREADAPSLLTSTESVLADKFNALPSNASLFEFIESLPSQSEGASFPSTTINALKIALEAQPIGTAAIYPLILKDRLEVILITADSAPIHISQPITETELNSVVTAMQNKLKTNTLLPTNEAQQLYDWLIRPLETTLTEQNIQNIIYLPDGILRYIPIAALHDGQKWFVESYQSHNITAASIDDLSQARTATPSVLAGAFTDDTTPHNVQVGQQQFFYEGLPAARQEIDNLRQLIPEITAFFDQDFTPANTLSTAENHQIIHLATHAKFLPGQPESSFVLFGDGSTVNVRDMGQWELSGVDLVVFSACQTAVSAEGDGKELLGLGFQIQQAGASSAIASLWSVDDISTATLMNQFYTALVEGTEEGKTKAEALRQAQLQLIESERFQHPYDWAAFILIGNGL